MRSVRQILPWLGILALPVVAFSIGWGRTQATSAPATTLVQLSPTNLQPWFYINPDDPNWMKSFNEAAEVWVKYTREMWVRADHHLDVWTALEKWQQNHPRCRILPAVTPTAWYRDDITDPNAWNAMARAINTWPILKTADRIFFDFEAGQTYRYLYDHSLDSLPWDVMQKRVSVLRGHMRVFVYPGLSNPRDRYERWVRFWQESLGTQAVIVDPLGMWGPGSLLSAQSIELRTSLDKLANAPTMPMLYCDVRTGYSPHWQPSQIPQAIAAAKNHDVILWIYGQLPPENGYTKFANGLSGVISPLP